MHRHVLYLVFSILVLQLSWSTVAAYCRHETGNAAQHVGHHSSFEGHQGSAAASGDQSAKAPSDTLHSHCSSCSHISLSAEAHPAALAVAEALRLAPPSRAPRFSSPYPAPPERPQWTAAA